MPSVFELAGMTDLTDKASASLASLSPESPRDYRELAIVLIEHWRTHERKLIGIGGGQGSGKSTLTHLIQQAALGFEEKVAVLSLDDFYFTQAERAKLAADMHELFETRGPPGTHDVDTLLVAVTELQANRDVEIPLFDKGIDDRAGTRLLGGDCTRIVIEGWCVGARPQSAEDLIRPINSLEQERDQEGVWRGMVNDHLRESYAQLTALLDGMVFLQVPGLDAVRRWRLQQEEDRPEKQRKDANWVDQFIQYYERLTQWMLRDMPTCADVLVELDDEHQVAGIRLD